MNEVALITGSTRGIGFGIAKSLAEKKFNIALSGVRPESAVQDAIHTIASYGVNVIYCQGNIALPHERTNILQRVKQHFGKLNVLVNNAGMAPRERRDVLETSEESFDEVIATNLKGPYFLTQACANWMIEQKNIDPNMKACIINISSVSAIIASINRGEYCISKAGLSMLTQLFASRLGVCEIPVYEVRPGIIESDMTAGVKEKYNDLIAKGLCIQKRWGQPEDVGMCVASLAVGIFPYSSGQIFTIDGGMTVHRL